MGRPAEAVVTVLQLVYLVIRGLVNRGLENRVYIPSRQYDDPSSMHLSQSQDRYLEFLRVSDLLGFGFGIPVCFGIFQGANEPVDARGHDMLGLVLFQHVHP
jgi:hypothetical protein